MARPDFRRTRVPAAPVAPVSMPPYPGSGATTKSSTALMLDCDHITCVLAAFPFRRPQLVTVTR